MQVGEEDQIRTKESVLGGLRLLDLYDQVRIGPDVGRQRQNGRSRRCIFGVRQGTPFTCAGFHQDAMAGFDQPGDGARDQTYAGFMVLDFLRNTDDHFFPLCQRDAGGVSAGAALEASSESLGPNPKPIRLAAVIFPFGVSF